MPEAVALAVHVVGTVVWAALEAQVAEQVVALHSLEFRGPGSGLSPLHGHQLTSNLSLAAEI